MSNSLIKLYSVFHKVSPIPKAGYVIPIQVGAANATTKLDMLHDDSGDNISIYNPHYSELTALYWIWKNEDRSKCDAWGLCHYRRYFTLDVRKLFFIKKSRVYYPLTQQAIDSVVTDKLYAKAEALLAENDVILQRPIYAHKKGGKIFNIKEAYNKAHEASDWKTTLDVLLEKYPEYRGSIDRFHAQTKMSYYNMMIARWDIWNNYLSWLFDILFEVQKRIEISADPYQARVFGFISERLLNLYVLHNKLKPAYLTIALFEK